MKKKLVLWLACVLLLSTVGCGKVDCGGAHNIVVDKAVPSSCDNTGLTRGEHCADCGLVIVAQETVPEAHFYEDYEENNYLYIKCRICGYKSAEKFSAGLEIEKDEGNNTCTVKGVGDCKDKEINISPVISGYAVEGIAKRAFSGERKITSIKVPNGVLSIGNYAFANCSKLVSITLPDSVTSMGTHMFYECGKLKSINIPAGVSTIGTGTFFSCGSLTSIVIPVGVEKIGMQCFASTGLNRVLFEGTEEEWSRITLDYGNGPLSAAAQYFFSEEKPADVGNYWHYVDGEAKVWG